MTVPSSAGHAQSDHRRGAQPDTANSHGAGAELSDVLDAVDVPIIVVDRDCKVVRFNHAAGAALGLTPLDVRRRPCDIEVLAGARELEKLCAQVIADAAPCRREIRHGDRRFLLRLAPYSASNGQIEGAVLTFTNVTAFRESIDRAIYEREYTKAILNTVIDPLVVLDSGLRVQTANRAFYSMFGASRDKTQGVQLQDLGDADWKASGLWAPLGAIVTDAGEFQPFEVEREFPALGPRRVLVDARRVARDGEANLLLTLHDITDRKKAEEDLRRGQEELVDFVENASVGMHWVGPDGIIQWANRTELELLGYAREEYIGRHIAKFHVEAAVIEDILRRLKSGEAVHDYAARLRCKDGSIRDVLINSNVQWEGNEFIHTRCFTRDITERKRAEEALRENEARFRALFESMDEGYCVVEVLFDAKNNALDYRFLETNPAFEKQTGITDAKGRLMRQIAPQHEQQWFDAYGSVALSGDTIRFESAAAALGRYYDVCAFRVGAPELRRVGVVFNDITERKKAEEVVRQSQKALLEADKRKDEFLATLAHELRNPLAPIRNSLHILRTVNASDPAVGRVQDMMERQVAHMVRLVDDLLELSRISRGQIELKKERIGLSTIVEHAVEASMPFIENHAHQLTVALPNEPLVVDGDLVRLAQVFANLLNNAAKYTQNGGRITLSARREGAMLVASVRDTGIGIPTEMLSRVFDMFAQVDSVLRRSQDGLGIGLNLVRSLVAMHGGSVEAHSDGLGQGSEFIVRLPLVEHLSLDTMCSVPRADVKGVVPRALRILVVDDNEDSADTLGMVLNRLGADVKIAYDGQSALEALRTYRPSVVILDLGMPGLDGHEVAHRVRQDPEFCDLPLIALTGWGQEENRRRTREAGFDHHLVKPVDLEVLQALLTSLDSQKGASEISAATHPISIV